MKAFIPIQKNKNCTIDVKIKATTITIKSNRKATCREEKVSWAWSIQYLNIHGNSHSEDCVLCLNDSAFGWVPEGGICYMAVYTEVNLCSLCRRQKSDRTLVNVLLTPQGSFRLIHTQDSRGWFLISFSACFFSRPAHPQGSLLGSYWKFSSTGSIHRVWVQWVIWRRAWGIMGNWSLRIIPAQVWRSP